MRMAIIFLANYTINLGSELLKNLRSFISAPTVYNNIFEIGIALVHDRFNALGKISTVVVRWRDNAYLRKCDIFVAMKVHLYFMGLCKNAQIECDAGGLRLFWNP